MMFIIWSKEDNLCSGKWPDSVSKVTRQTSELCIAEVEQTQDQQNDQQQQDWRRGER